jgi:diacylglycerol kinase family enzyme
VPAPETALDRAEQLAESVLPDRTPKRRMLIIVNPYATTVSDRLKNLVVYALQGRYDVEAIDTQRQGHAVELCREAADEGYDVVVAFGGDGTVNEAANGLVGSETPLTFLPGGSTNVVCRTLGIPSDVVDATEHLLRMADQFEPRRIDLGRLDERYFVSSSGIGLDASVVEQVDAHPRLKSRFGEYYFTWAAVSNVSRKYFFNPARVRVEAGGHVMEGVTVIVQNSDPFTYFGKRPIRICDGVQDDDGRLSLAILKRSTPVDIPTLIPRIFAANPARMLSHRQMRGLTGLERISVKAEGERPFPVQVDGDYAGEFSEVTYSVAPRSLSVVS